MNLKSELDRIYLRVYSTNESNSEDQKIIIAGFENALNEGIGKLLGKAAGWVSSIPNKVKKGVELVGDKAKDLYNKGKEMGKEAISKVTDWLKRTGEKISGMLDQWGTKIKEGWNNFTSWCQLTYQKIGTSLTEFWEATKDKGAKLIESLGVFWENMKNKLKNAYEQTKKRFVEFGGNISDWVNTNWENLKNWSKEKYDGALEWLRAKYEWAIETLRTKGGVAAAKIKEAAKWIATWLAIKPYTWIANNIKKIPELYKRFKEWLQKQAQEFKLGFEETSGRPFNREKGFIIPTTFPEANVSGETEEEEEIKSNYDASKDPFSLGEKNEWEKIGISKRTAKGRPVLSEILDKWKTLKDLKDNEKTLAIGAWMAENIKNADLVKQNTEEVFSIIAGKEKDADELQKRIDSETDKKKIAELKRELRNLKQKDSDKVDEDAIGQTTVEVIRKISKDPRLALYYNSASEEDITKSVEYLLNKNMLDQLIGINSNDLKSTLKSKGLTDKAISKLMEKMPTKKKRNVMPLPEMQFEEGMKYIQTFENFKR